MVVIGNIWIMPLTCKPLVVIFVVSVVGFHAQLLVVASVSQYCIWAIGILLVANVISLPIHPNNVQR